MKHMQLQTNPDNPRTISRDSYEKLKRSIERNPDGLTANKIAHKGGLIISGNQRYRALQELGLEHKPEWFKDLSGWTEEQIEEWVITSNVSAGEWDWDILANEWDDTQLEEWGVDLPTLASDFTDTFDLDTNKQSEHFHMTFAFTEYQAGYVTDAIRKVKQMGHVRPEHEYENDNSNANALYEIVEQWAKQKI